MQGVQLSPKLLGLQFDCFGVTALLPQLLMQLLQLMLVVALGAINALITLPDPAGGESLQIRATIPVRTAEIIGQCLTTITRDSGDNYRKQCCCSKPPEHCCSQTSP